MLRPGVATDEQDLREHCARELAAFKVPRHVEVVAEIPRSSSSKVVRRALADRWREQEARA